MYRSVLTAIMIVVLAITNFTPALANDAKPTYTPQDYVAYLTKRGESEPEALKVRDQFLKLSKEKQLKFVRYVSDPKIMAEVLRTKVPENSSVSLYNGDIVIEHKTEIEVVEPEKHSTILSSLTSFLCGHCFAAPPAKTIRLADVQHIKIIGGIKVGSLYVWVLYSVQGNVVKSVIDGNGYCKKWYPVIFKKESVSKYVHGNKAQTCIVWNITSPIIGGIDASWNNRILHHDVIGNARGQKSYRYYED